MKEFMVFSINYDNQNVCPQFVATEADMEGLTLTGDERLNYSVLYSETTSRINPWTKETMIETYYYELKKKKPPIHVSYCPDLEACVVWCEAGALEPYYLEKGQAPATLKGVLETVRGAYIFDHLPLEVRLQKCKPAPRWGNIDADGDCYHHGL